MRALHVVLVQQFASVSLFDATTDASAKAHVLPDEAEGGIPHQLFNVGTSVVSDSRKVRFLLGGEVYFHGAERRDYWDFCQ
jgi:hypothetical protein